MLADAAADAATKRRRVRVFLFITFSPFVADAAGRPGTKMTSLRS